MRLGSGSARARAVRAQLFLEGPRLGLARARGQKRRVPGKGPGHNNLS